MIANEEDAIAEGFDDGSIIVTVDALAPVVYVSFDVEKKKDIINKQQIMEMRKWVDRRVAL